MNDAPAVPAEEDGTEPLPRLPRRLTPAPLDDGPHLNYAVQWFLFAVLAVVFAVVVVARRGS